ncbi:MAG TPA: hypothetical protein VII90_07055, partial [Anaerolineales bacterium]
DRRHIAHQPLRELGTHKVPIRLTVDLIPEVVVVVRGEGEEGQAAVVAPVPVTSPVPAAPRASTE